MALTRMLICAYATQGTQFDIDSMQRTTDDVSQCTPSVECANYKDEAAAVVDIYAIDLRLGAMGLCTGTALPHVVTDSWHTTMDLHPSMKPEVDAPCCGIRCSSLVCPPLTPVGTSWSRLCSKGVVLPT